MLEDAAGVVVDPRDILQTSVNGIYAMHARGRLPPMVGFGRKLLWRRDDLLMSSTRRASSLERGIRR